MHFLTGIYPLLATLPAPLAQAADAAAAALAPPPGYTPFVSPLPVWDAWPWLLVPLLVGVSIVYKSVKCRSMATVPKEAAQILVLILVLMAAAAGALAAVVEFAK